MTTLYPIGYASRLVPLAELRRVHEPKMHPEFARRLFAWLEAQGGKFGIGGGWRETQPDKPGVAPEGKSFHQDQRFASGFVGYCAVDLVCQNPGQVHRAPTWAEVPAQGSEAAKRALVHCNVGTPGVIGSEPWHMQPIEIDGWQTWVDAGRPDPKAPEVPVYEYFTLKPIPATLWQQIAPGVAVRVEGETVGARGGLPSGGPPRVLTEGEAARYVFLNGLTAASTK